MSKKLVPAEWISMRYLSDVGKGVGRSAILRSRGPYLTISECSYVGLAERGCIP